VIHWADMWFPPINLYNLPPKSRRLWVALDEDGEVFRWFYTEDEGRRWVNIRPEFKLKKWLPPKPTYEKVSQVGDALF
jgi:DNA topoisomerase IB